MSRVDPHSYADSAQPRTKRVRLSLDVHFDRQVIEGEAVLELAAPSEGPLDLDSKGLAVRSVRSAERDLPFELAEEEPVLGRRLRVVLPPRTSEVAIRYATAPDAAALQWLSPEQTEGKRHPFLFSQCQPIHARTLAPLQDSPAVRVTYAAAVTVPEELSVVMSAGATGSEPGRRPGTKTLLFEMPQPIPTYLLALAVGRLEGRDLSPRCRVYAEPETVRAAAWEFDGVEAMIGAAERLFGPYEWERFDLLVLPPSFPYGGMENPRMTFLTPTLLSGDRSLVDVVAHELAHSWTGNLVTNATMDHFWLNEGFTVWAERRILEALEGEPRAVLGWAIGEKALEGALKRFGPTSPHTCLRTDLQGVDPDDVFSSIPYEKGSRFVALLERAAGRERWDRFMREYMSRFHFTSITTEELLAFLEERLPGLAASVDARTWLYEPGIPGNAPVFRSAALEEITALAKGWGEGKRPASEQVARWSPDELLVYLQNVPREMSEADCAWLDQQLSLNDRGNHELLVEWLTIAAGSDYEPAFGKLRNVLTRVGRMKYLRPLYTALGRHPRTRALAREIFEAARPGYHLLSRRLVESVMTGWDTGTNAPTV